MEKNVLKFVQKNDKNGSCTVYLNGQEIDGCDMNFERKYTQAHIVLASVVCTIKSEDIEVIIESLNETVEVGSYSIEDIKGMSVYLYDREFNPLY